MKGKYEIVVSDKRLQYKFTLERNFTILRGDSATGKTTLISMIYAYQRNQAGSGVTIQSDKKCVVLDAVNWQINLKQIKDSFVFIDEGDSFVKSDEFANAIRGTDNYYVIATRASLFALPYSVKEPILMQYVKEDNLKDAVADIRRIEEKIRNLAAHQIVSVTNESIQKILNEKITIEKIFKYIQTLTIASSVKTDKECWESYDRMNEYIIDKLSR